MRAHRALAHARTQTHMQARLRGTIGRSHALPPLAALRPPRYHWPSTPARQIMSLEISLSGYVIRKYQNFKLQDLCRLHFLAIPYNSWAHFISTLAAMNTPHDTGDDRRDLRKGFPSNNP